MAENEIEVHAKAGTPEVLGFGASLEVKLKRSWQSRGKDVTSAALERAAIDEGELEARLLADDGAAALFWKVLNRAAEVGDAEYVATLGRLLGASLDDAIADEAAYMTRELANLEPVHLRVILQGFRFTVSADNAAATRPDLASYAAVIPIDTDALASQLGVTEEAAGSMQDRAVTSGFIDLVATSTGELYPTAWAARVLEIAFPNLGEIVGARDDHHG